MHFVMICTLFTGQTSKEGIFMRFKKLSLSILFRHIRYKNKKVKFLLDIANFLCVSIVQEFKLCYNIFKRYIFLIHWLIVIMELKL